MWPGVERGCECRAQPQGTGRTVRRPNVPGQSPLERRLECPRDKPRHFSGRGYLTAAIPPRRMLNSHSESIGQAQTGRPCPSTDAGYSLARHLIVGLSTGRASLVSDAVLFDSPLTNTVTNR